MAGQRILAPLIKVRILVPQLERAARAGSRVTTHDKLESHDAKTGHESSHGGPSEKPWLRVGRRLLSVSNGLK